MQYETTCKHELYPSFTCIFFHVFCLYLVYFLVFSSYGKSFDLFYVIFYCVGAGITNLMPISDGLDPYFFLSKDGKDAVHEKRNGRTGVYFPPVSAFFLHRKYD